MSVSLVELKLESPTILVERAGRAGYSSISGRIGGSTLRGSIISWAFRMGYVRDIGAERNDPKLIVHPAYPTRGGETARPPTPYIFECKERPRRLVDTLGRERVRELSLASSLEEMLSLSGSPSSECDLMKDIPGSTVRVRSPIIGMEAGEIEEVDVMASVGINKMLRAAERGMLYNYEVILPGAEFSTLIVDMSEGRYIEFIKNEKRLFIGRGISRGFGRVSVTVKWEKDMEPLIEDLKGKVDEWIFERNGRRRIALYSRSPAASISLSRENGYIASPIPEADEGWLRGKIEISKDSAGRPLAIGFRTVFRSVAYPTGLPRPSFFCSREGSVFIAELSGDASAAVALGSLIGWDRSSCLGLNIIQPLGWWYDDPLYHR